MDRAAGSVTTCHSTGNCTDGRCATERGIRLLPSEMPMRVAYYFGCVNAIRHICWPIQPKGRLYWGLLCPG